MIIKNVFVAIALSMSVLFFGGRFLKHQNKKILQTIKKLLGK